MALDSSTEQGSTVVRALVVTVAILALGAPAQADDVAKQPLGAPEIYAGESVVARMPADWNGTEKVLETYCRTNKDTGSWLAVLTPSAMITVSFCNNVTLTVTRGDSDIYQYWQEPWNLNQVPPGSGAGTLVCQSTNSGTATDTCNGCSYFCGYGLNGVWRDFTYVYAGPSDYCMVWTGNTCTDVDVADATIRRHGTAVELRWEVRQESGVAGYNLLRRLTPEEPWVKVNESLIAATGATGYRHVDQVPATAGDVEYRLEEVTLDGRSSFLLRLIDRVDPAQQLSR